MAFSSFFSVIQFPIVKEYASLFPSFFHSRQISSFNHLDVLPYNFQMLFRATWRAPFDKERVAKTRFNATRATRTMFQVVVEEIACYL